MSKRRRQLIGATVLVLFGAPPAMWLLWPTSPPSLVTREAAPKVRVGMVLAEVEATLGGPARNEETGWPLHIDTSTVEGEAAFRWCANQLNFPKHTCEREWSSDCVRVMAFFDDEECVVWCGFLFLCHQRQTPLQTLHRWLRL
jgi:hypothetical protein